MAEVIFSKTFFYALLGGILPALIWLIFWLKEDAKRPEPKGLILRTFLLGMLAVVLVIPGQRVVNAIFPGLTVIAFMLWSLMEEIFKFTAAYIGGLRSKDDNEPLDPLIYVITAALGFVALENTLYIFNPLVASDLVGSIITGNLRFIGASLLHTVSSGFIGLALSLTFYKRRVAKVGATLFAMFVAIVFHAMFNVLIIASDSRLALVAFGAVWGGVALLLLSFEKVKTIAYRGRQDIINTNE